MFYDAERVELAPSSELLHKRIEEKIGDVVGERSPDQKLHRQIVAGIFRAAFANEWLDQGNDQASLPTPTNGRMVMTTDGYVVSPLFFPGGDIGSLAVHGTINDIAMAGARPLYLSGSFIIEEGFPFCDLKRIPDSMGRAATDASVPIVAGDTKVVERGKADGVFIRRCPGPPSPAGL